MIEHLKTYPGYCAQCQQPGLVGEFKLRGWQHVFTMCSPCLSKLTDRVVNNSTAPVAEQK